MTEKPIILIATDISQEELDKLHSLARDWELRFLENMEESDYWRVQVIYNWQSNIFNDEKVLDELQQLQWIQLMSAGADRVPQKIQEQNQITITNVSGIHKETITEMVFAYILSYNHQFFESRKWQEQKEWHKPRAHKLHILKGQSLLVFGAGNIGQELGRIGQAFGMETIGVNTSGESRDYFDQMIKLEEWPKVIDKVDVVVNALPSTKATESLYNQEFFQAMKETALFINIGRGSAVVEDDLMKALKSQWIAGSYLDVFQKEPLTEDSPLWETPNLTITAHYSGSFDNYDQRAFEIFEENLKHYVEFGKPAMNIISKERGY